MTSAAALARPAAATPTTEADEAPADVAEQSRAAFGVQPANAQGGIDDRAFFQYGLPPQSSIFDYVGIVNYGAEPLTLSVYATDAVSSETGDFSLLPGAQAPSDTGSWITIGDGGGPTQVDVPPAGDDGPGKVVLPVTIAVPQNATPGDHAGGVLAVLTTLGENPQGQNVQLEQRVAARVYLRLDGDLAPGLTVSDIQGTYRRGSLPWQAGSLDLRYTVTNPGNVRMGVQPSATVTGPFGVNERRGTAEPFAELLPKGGYTVEQSIDGVWPLFSLPTSIRLEALAAPGAEVPDLAPVTAGATVTAVPWQFLLALLIIAILVALLIWGRRRGRRRAAPPRPSPAPKEPVGVGPARP